VGNLYVDALVNLKIEAQTVFQEWDSPCGKILLTKLENLLMEWILVAVCPLPNQRARDCAAKLMAVCVDQESPFKVDWEEIRRLAASPAYQVSTEVEALKTEVATTLESEGHKLNLSVKTNTTQR
jgi:hypothetical protein